MDENLEKKPKRPRIGEAKPVIEDTESPRYERSDYGQQNGDQVPQHGGYQGGGYQRPSYDRPSYGGGYQSRGGYQPRYPQQRYNPDPSTDANPEDAAKSQAEGQEMDSQQPRQGGYQPRQGGGYQPRQGGYQPRQGGYQPRQGGYQP